MQNLNFILIGRSDSDLTQIWEVRSVHRPELLLGEVRWYAPWRQYSYQIRDGNIYDATCLTEIAKFMQEQMQIRAQDRQLR